VFDAAAVAAVSDTLADPIARIRGLRTRGPFELPFPTAIKTGTSTAYRDAWTAGYTRERAVVVWVGNADGSATKKLTGAVGAGPLFFDVMKRAMRDVSTRAPLYDAELLEEADVCPLSGHRPGPACTDHVHRKFPRGHAPAVTCTLHQFATTRVAPQDEPAFRCDPHGTERIVLLPPTFAFWLSERPPGVPGADAHGVPWFLGSRVPGCAAPSGEEPRIVVVEPRDGAVLAAAHAHDAADALEIAVETRGLPSAEPLEVVVDGRIAMRLDAPYRGRVPIARGDHLLEVRPLDSHRAAMLGRAQVSVR
jgi:penicillin-binding protein 1C